MSDDEQFDLTAGADYLLRCRGKHPDLTVTETGCHVWKGTNYPPCHLHGTPNCCLIAHASPAAQRAFDIPRCVECGRWMPKARWYWEDCGRHAG